jgi:hypothetical protein
MEAFADLRKTTGCITLAALTLMFSACASKTDATDSARESASSAADSINIRKDRSEDLTGDGVNEKLSLTARGSQMDSLRVRLEIRSADDSLLYASSWSSRFYFQYVERAGMTDAAADSTVRRHLDAVLADTAFRTGAPRPAADTIGASMMRDAIRYDIATNQWRTQHGLALGDGLPPTAHDSINDLAAAVPKEQIDALYQELQGKKSFTFFAGGEVTYSIAWSAREQRFVTIFSCC